MRLCTTLAATLGLWATQGIAQSALPHTGTCRHDYTVLSVTISTDIHWFGETATLGLRGDTIEGQVVGLRPHDEAFKLSILFEDPITGPSEMVIFELPGSDPVRYRRAIIGYDMLPDGQRVVSNVSGFEDITCTMLE